MPPRPNRLTMRNCPLTRSPGDNSGAAEDCAEVTSCRKLPACASPASSLRTSATTLGLSPAASRKASRAAAGWSSARSNRDLTRGHRSGVIRTLHRTASRRVPIEGIDFVGADAVRSDEGIVGSRCEPVSHPYVLRDRDALCLPVAHAHTPPGSIITESPVEQEITLRGPAWPTAHYARKLGLLPDLKVVEHGPRTRRRETCDESPVGRPAGKPHPLRTRQG